MLTACADPEVAPEFAVDAALEEAPSGTWKIRIFGEATVEVAGMVVEQQTCFGRGEITVDGRDIYAESVPCVFEDGREEYFELEGTFDPAPWAVGELDGDGYYVEWDGGLHDDGQLHGVFTANSGRDGGELTFEGYFEAMYTGVGGAI